MKKKLAIFTLINLGIATLAAMAPIALIGVLFVLLAADVRVAEVVALGVPGLATVAILILLVRPLGVAVATWAAKPTARADNASSGRMFW